MSINKPLVIYHKNCLDGFAAAFAFWYHFEDAYEYLAAAYEDTPPDVTGREVYLVDFSYKREVVKKMLSKAVSIIFLDHHKTAIEDLAGLADEEGCGNFVDKSDNTRSGCALAWMFASPPNAAMPRFMKAIEDHDLWKFELPHTKEIVAYLYSQPFSFEKWDEFYEHTYPIMIANGGFILQLRQKQIKEIIAIAVETTIYCNGQDYQILIVNCPRWLASDVGAELAKDKPFSVTYFDNATHRTYSLRSVKDVTGGFDVSQIAKHFDGGGHRNAAGFVMSLHKNLYRSLEN